MLKVSIMELVDNKWEPRDCPSKTTERIEHLKGYVGKDAVVKIETTRQHTYLCGTERTFHIMSKQYPSGKTIMCIEDAIDFYEYDPEKFFVSIQAFWDKNHVEMFDPPAPTIASKGWTKPAENS